MTERTGRPTLRDQQKAQTRRNLLEQAKALFVERGYLIALSPTWFVQPSVAGRDRDAKRKLEVLQRSDRDHAHVQCMTIQNVAGDDQGWTISVEAY